MKLTFTVHGLPQTAGSKRGFPFKRADGKLGVRVADDNPKTKSWQGQVVSEAARVMGTTLSATVADGQLRVERVPEELFDGPLSLTVSFFLPRPKGHLGAKGLRPSAPPYPIGRPDLLKLTRAIEDALTGVVWRDDAQIVKEHLQKVYGEPAKVMVVVETIDEAEKGFWFPEMAATVG